VTPELLTRIGGRKPSGSAATSDDLLTGSVVETVDQVLGAVGEFRKVVSAAGAIVSRAVRAPCFEKAMFERSFDLV
jgi:hypothetical protein